MFIFLTILNMTGQKTIETAVINKTHLIKYPILFSHKNAKAEKINTEYSVSIIPLTPSIYVQALFIKVFIMPPGFYWCYIKYNNQQNYITNSLYSQAKVLVCDNSLVSLYCGALKKCIIGYIVSEAAVGYSLWRT